MAKLIDDLMLTLDGVLQDAKDWGQNKWDNAEAWVQKVETTAKAKYDDIQKIIEDASQEDYFADFYERLEKAAENGKNPLKEEALRLKDKYQARLDKLAKTNPKRAGFYDGWLNSIAGTSTDRSSNEEYKEGVGVGKAIGYGSSALMLLGGNVILGGAPAIVRGARYLHKKYQEAKTK